MTALLGLFAISFGWVFVQAFQSRNVNSGQYAWAAAGSWAIGNLQVLVLSSVIGPHSSFLSTQVYCLGGGVGVVSAMYVHRRFLARKASHA
jgi:hypothetical protein